MRHTILFLLLFSGWKSLLGFYAPCDPLLSLYLNEAQIDSLIEECFIIRATDDSKLLELANIAICESKKINYRTGEAAGYLQLGLYHYIKSEYDSAVVILNELYFSINHDDRPDLLADASNYLALVYLDLGYVDIAIYYQSAFLLYSQKAKDPKRQGEAIANIAFIYYSIGEYQLGLDKMIEAQKFYSQDVVVEDNGWTNKTMGQLYGKLGNLEKSSLHFEEALSIWDQLKSQRGKSRTLLEYGVAQSISNKNFALELLEEALQVNEEVQNKELIANAEYHIASIYQSLNHTEKFIEHAQKSYEVSNQFGIKIWGEKSLRLLSSYYQKTGAADKEVNTLRALSVLNNKDQFLKKKLLDRWIEYQNRLIKQQNENLNLKSKELKNKQKFNLLIAFVVFISLLMLTALTFYIKAKGYNDSLINLNNNISEQLKTIDLQKQQLEIANQKIKGEKEKTDQELTRKVLSLANQQEMLGKLTSEIAELTIATNSKYKLTRLIKSHQKENIWNELDFQLMKMNEEFYSILSTKHPNLTTNELRLCSFLKMNLSQKDIARLSHKSVGSVKTASSRLRNKIELDSSINIGNYLNSLMNKTKDIPS